MFDFSFRFSNCLYYDLNDGYPNSAVNRSKHQKCIKNAYKSYENGIYWCVHNHTFHIFSWFKGVFGTSMKIWVNLSDDAHKCSLSTDIFVFNKKIVITLTDSSVHRNNTDQPNTIIIIFIRNCSKTVMRIRNSKLNSETWIYVCMHALMYMCVSY